MGTYIICAALLLLLGGCLGYFIEYHHAILSTVPPPKFRGTIFPEDLR